MADAGRLPKPVLRGHLLTSTKKHMAIAVTLSFAASMAWKFFVADPRKKAYADFYRDYDADAEYEKMKPYLLPLPEWDTDEE